MTNLHLLILLGLILVPILGLALFIFGWRGRRVDDLPYCRKCRFSLAGLDTTSPDAKCPECGRRLDRPRAVGIGRRRKRLSLLIAGSFLLLAALAGGGVLGWGAATSFNWNTVKPVWLLEMDTGSTSGPAVAGAYAELTSRLNAGTLADDDARRFVQRALAYQRSYARPWSPEIGDFIEAARLRRLVSMDDWVLYHRQGISLSGRLRTQIRQGAPLPFEVRARGPRMGSSGGLWIALERHSIGRESGEELASHPGAGFMPIEFGGQSWITGTFDIDLPVGRHGLIQFVDVGLAEGVNADPIARWTVEYESFVTVVDAPSTVPGDRSGEADAAVRDAMSVERLILSGPPSTPSGTLTIRATDLPIDCAFDILAIINGEEKQVGHHAFHAGSGANSTGFPVSLPGFDGDTITIILRANPDAAERTIDMVEYWTGEIRLEDVPVTWADRLRRPADPVGPSLP